MDALIEPLKVIIIVAVCKILSVNIGCSTLNKGYDAASKTISMSCLRCPCVGVITKLDTLKQVLG